MSPESSPAVEGVARDPAARKHWSEHGMLPQAQPRGSDGGAHLQLLRTKPAVQDGHDGC